MLTPHSNMRKQIKTLVRQDMEVMQPFVTRDKGQVPPMLFFHFKSITPEVQEQMNTTMNNDVVNVENGFFVPLVREQLLSQQEVFMDFMSTVMSSLTHMKIAGELHAVVIIMSGSGAKVDKKTQQVESEADLFIASGTDAKGKSYTEIKELKQMMGKDGIVYEVTQTDLMDEFNGQTEDPFIAPDFFQRYEHNLQQLPEDKKNLGILSDSMANYDNDPVQFTADLIDAAIHATVLFESMQNQTR